MDLYKRYLKERENTELISQEYGFVTYRFEQEYCYIIDIYILPEYRKAKLGANLERMVIAQAHEQGYNKLLGSVDTNANNWEKSLEILERSGYREKWRADSTIYLIKGI